MVNQNIAQKKVKNSKFVLEETEFIKISRSQIKKLLENNLNLPTLKIYLTLREALADGKVIHAQKFCHDQGIRRSTLSKKLKEFEELGYLTYDALDATRRRYIIHFTD